MYQTIGFDSLDERELAHFDKLFSEYSKKIERKLKKISAFIINVKAYRKSGSRKKFSVHVRVVAPTKIFEAEAYDWDFRRVLHKVFNKLEEEIEHRFRVSDEHKR